MLISAVGKSVVDTAVGFAEDIAVGSLVGTTVAITAAVGAPVGRKICSVGSFVEVADGSIVGICAFVFRSMCENRITKYPNNVVVKC